MAIIYASFEVQLRGIDVLNEDELDVLQKRIQQLLDYGLTQVDGRPRRYRDDVEVHLLEAVRSSPRRAVAS